MLAFQAGGPTFTVAGAPIDRDAVVAQAGLDYHATPTLTIGLTGSGQAGGRASDGSIQGNIAYRF